MGHKRKLEHFAEIRTFSNVLEVGYDEVLDKPHELKGKWRERIFKNGGPVIIELGCGKGEYTLGLGTRYPDANFIGMDIKGARMWRGAKTAIESELNNVFFLRCRIEFVASFFDAGEVDEIWITFPDPQAQSSRSKKRLTSPEFLNRYFQFLKKDGIIHLKTDSDFLYNYTTEVIEKHKLKTLVRADDLYRDLDNLGLEEIEKEVLNVRTHYEKLFTDKGHTIHYLRFKR